MYMYKDPDPAINKTQTHALTARTISISDTQATCKAVTSVAATATAAAKRVIKPWHHHLRDLGSEKLY